MMIRVAGTLAKPKNPIEDATDANTMATPPTPRVILLSICMEGRLEINTNFNKLTNSTLLLRFGSILYIPAEC